MGTSRGVLFAAKTLASSRKRQSQDGCLKEVPISRQLMAVRAESCSASYLRHLLSYHTERLRTDASGLIPGISREDVLSLAVGFPSKAEQHQIADILDTVDAAIRRTEEVIAKLELVKKGLLHDLLTRGIDENGELRDPERHPEQFKESELGRIPRGWEVRPLEEYALFVTSGSRGWASYYAREGPLFIRIGNLTREHINLDLGSVVKVVPPPGSDGKRTRLKEGDLLVSITADLGIIGVVPENLGESYVNQHIALVRLDRCRVNPRWVGHYMAGPRAQEKIRRLDDPGAKAGLNLPTVRGLLVALPSKQEQDGLAMILDHADRRISSERLYREKLRLLKKALMDDLLTGKVRVTPLLEKEEEEPASEAAE